MKKFITLFAVAVLCLSVLAGCQSESSSDKVESSTKKTEVNIRQFKVEFNTQLEAFAEKFMTANPDIQVNIVTVGGGSDYHSALKSAFASGDEPAIFNVGGPSDVQEWEDRLRPLNDVEWLNKHFEGTLEPATKDGNRYGVPYGLEGYGLIYNKKMFEAAGIDATKITTYSNLEEAIKILDRKKSELGIDFPVSYTVSEWWVMGNHTSNIPFTSQDDPAKFIEGLNAGTESIVNNDKFNQWVELLDLLIKYGPSDITQVDYNKQVTSFASGKAALLHQGNWTMGMINEIDDSLEVGFLPLAFTDEDAKYNKSIPVGVPMYWAVNKNVDEKVQNAAIKFLEYMFISEEGHDFLVNEAGFIPALPVDLEITNQLGKSITEYSEQGNTLEWKFMSYPQGYAKNEISPAFQKYYQEVYIDGKDRETAKMDFLAALESGWKRAAGQ